MANITIRETDSTVAESFVLDESVVYIPGFSALTEEEAASQTAVLKPGPKLCTSLSEFRKYFGKYAPVFSETQTYPDGFAADAKPSDNVMFKVGTCDPSYVIATQLLSAGLSVVYNKINETTFTPTYVATASLADATVDTTKFVGEVGPTVPMSYRFAATTISRSTTFTPSIAETTFEFTKGGENVFFTKIGGKSASVAFTYSSGTWSAKIDNEETQVLTGGIEEFGLKLKEGATPSSFTVAATVVMGWKLNETRYDADAMSNVFGITGLPETPVSFNVSVTLQSATVDNGTISVDAMYENLATAFDAIRDVDSFSIDFITSGGYPTFEYGSLANTMSQIAKLRGDCVALIDHTNNRGRAIGASDATSVYHKVNASAFDGEEYAAMFTPYASYGISGVTYLAEIGTTVVPKLQNYAELPGSFAYLSSLASSLSSNNASWLAIAGVNRGRVPAIDEVLTNTTLTNAIANSYQPLDNQSGATVAINPITNIAPYGQTIWGNRTLKPVDTGLKATNFLNLRNLINDVKKVARVAARACMFENNTSILWIQFKSLLAPTLDRMQTGYGIKDYKIVIDENASTKYRLVANIKLYPVYAIEEFDVTVSFEEDSVIID